MSRLTVREVYLYGAGPTEVYLKSEVDALLRGRAEPTEVGQGRERPKANGGPRVLFKRRRRST